MTTKNSFVKTIQIISFALTALFGASMSAEAQKEVGIAAIVDDSAISNVDLQERIKIAMFAANLPKGKGLEEKLLPQILRNLVDERLYMKEAEKLDVAVNKEDISRVVTDIEKRNNIQPGKFNEYLKFNGISQNIMMEQIKSQLTWSKVVAYKIRPQISVTDKEIDEKLEHISKQAGTEEVNISEILLPVDNVGDDKKTKDAADKLARQLKDGSNFSKIAKQFSKASSAENGGDVGWLRMGQLPDEVATIIKSLHSNEVSNPIKIAEGYTILKLNERRIPKPTQESEIGLKRAFIAIDKNASTKDIKKAEDKIQKSQRKIKNCSEFPQFAEDIGSSVNSEMTISKTSELSPEISKKVANLKIGEFSKIITTDDGLSIFMVCERTDAAETTALKNKIREGLFIKKLEIQANRYLRDLRRGAFIEVRI